MIYGVEGTPGAGKTYYALRKIVEALDAGKPVVTNVDLVDDVARRVARRHWVRWLVPGRRLKVQRRIERSLLITQDLDELMRVRVPGRGEDRWVVVIDEGAGFFGAREWSKRDREQRLEWFRHHRKYGATVYVIAQDIEMLDANLRRVFEVVIRLRNLRRARVAGIPIAPFNLFLAIHTWAGGNRITMRRETYRLDWRKDLYDTTQIVHGEGHDASGMIVLPRAPEPAQAPPTPSVMLLSAEGRDVPSAAACELTAETEEPAVSAAGSRPAMDSGDPGGAQRAEYRST